MNTLTFAHLMVGEMPPDTWPGDRVGGKAADVVDTVVRGVPDTVCDVAAVGKRHSTL